MAMLRLLFLLIALLVIVDSCSIAITDPCQSVKCRKGLTCRSETNYYCPDIIGGMCPPVAICGQGRDPCSRMRCSDGQACVKVKDPGHCSDNQPCRLIGQCQATMCPGNCPAPTDIIGVSSGSCSNPCKDSDEMCQTGAKCCFSAEINSKVCVRAISSSA